MVDTRHFGQEGGDNNVVSTDGALQANSVLQNRYRIEGVLGIGGMGSVYQARDLQFPDAKRYVAVKEMLHHTNDPELREMALRNFQREANILAGLNHPAIPTIYDYFSTKERAYLVMEYIDGSDLDSVISKEEGFISVIQMVEWMITLCDVLSYLHTSEPPIVFRDMKPSNIMIDVYGRARLIDFGIAKAFEPSQKGTMIGTEGYAAPESYQGRATPASDIFGIGATMHHAFTRHDPRLEPPFTFAERPIRDVNPEVPVELEAVVMKSLAFKPEERFQNAQEMKDALQNVLSGGRSTILSSSGPLAEDGWADLDENAGVEPRWIFRAEEEIRSSPVSLNNLVFITAYDNNLYALNTENGELRWKFPAEDAIAGSAAVDEQESLAIFGSKDWHIYAVDLRSGRLKWSYETQGPIYSSPAIRHGHVFFGSDDGIIYALRLGTGRLAWKYDVQAPIRSKPAITDDKVIFGTKTGELYCLDLSGQSKWRFKARREIMSSPHIYNNILAFFGSMDGHVYAVDIETSWAAWKVQTNRPVVSSPTFGEEKVFVGGVNGNMYAFEYGTGRERWKTAIDAQITSSPAYYNGAIYFGANDNKIYCLDAKNGKERWTYTTGGIIPGSPHIADGVLYIGSTDHKLYAFKA